MSDETKKDSGPKHEGPARTSPYPMSRLAPSHDLVDVARRIAEADAMVGAVASAKLRTIAEQIRALQDEARRVLEDTRATLELHRARCSFVRKPGHVYHLYRRGEDDLYFSMLAPDDWRGAPPHELVGSYRLELDQSWTRVDDATGHDPAPAPDQLVRRLLGDGS